MKLNIGSHVTITAFVFLVCSAVAWTQTMELQTGTRFFWEVEWMEPPPPWKLRSDLAGHSGSGFFDYGNNGRGKGEMKFRFKVTKAGKYIATIRGGRFREGSCKNSPSDHCNDVFTKMDEKMKYCKTMIKGGWDSWLWQSRIAECGDYSARPVKYDLQVGEHTFYLKGRSNGMKVDAVAVYLEGTQQPTRPLVSSRVKVSDGTQGVESVKKGTAFDAAGRLADPTDILHLVQPVFNHRKQWTPAQ